MATCPKGHESATADYCDVCGTPIAGSPAPEPVSSPAAAAAAAAAEPEAAPKQSAPAPGETCPRCGTPRTGRFCEEDGYDFVLAPPVEAAPAAPASAAPAPAAAADPAAPALAGPAPGAGGWQVVVGADRSYFATVQSMAGEDGGALAFPPFVAERRFALTGDQMLVGRRSRSRGVHPDIDLVGPPEDPGVSHVHALLVARPDGWAVVDLDSANGTYVNEHTGEPIPPNTPVPVRDGDRIYIGAWTTLTVQANGS